MEHTEPHICSVLIGIVVATFGLLFIITKCLIRKGISSYQEEMEAEKDLHIRHLEKINKGKVHGHRG